MEEKLTKVALDIHFYHIHRPIWDSKDDLGVVGNGLLNISIGA